MEENVSLKELIKKQMKINKVLCIIFGLFVSIIITITIYKGVKKALSPINLDPLTEKPIIYIYPEEETNVSVKVGYPENLTCTYPKYEEGWEVTAYPDGNLKDVKTGKNLYALYWEGLRSQKTKIEDGFIVEGKDVAKFLEEKLEILGLNERESEEFIVYWLPILEKNQYNLIRFYEKEEIDEFMPLEINPEPETVIRVLMGWKKVDSKMDIKEQKFEKAERAGYTVVEWGGTEIKGSVIK